MEKGSRRIGKGKGRNGEDNGMKRKRKEQTEEEKIRKNSMVGEENGEEYKGSEGK